MTGKTGLAIVVLLVLTALLLVVLPGRCSAPDDHVGGPSPPPKDASPDAPRDADPDARRRQLVVYVDTVNAQDGKQQAMEALKAAFEAAHPVDVQLESYDRKNFETDIVKFLRDPGSGKTMDVFTWHVGYRIRALAAEGLLVDLSALWNDGGLNDAMKSSRPAVAVLDEQAGVEKPYGVPYTADYWGVYYKRAIFDRPGWTRPETWQWQELIAACKKLDKSMAPFAIGTSVAWPAAAWFDYLNVRINGRDFHRRLMDGRVPYTHDRVKEVFRAWRQLIQSGCFLDRHDKFWWRDTISLLVKGKAAMYLFDLALRGELPGSAEERWQKYNLVRFPSVAGRDEEVEAASSSLRTEVTPIDTLHVSRNAANADDAIRFLAFSAQRDQQAALNERLGQVSPRKDVWPSDPFLKKSAEIIWQADSLTSFYEVNTHPDVARAGTDAFREFMLRPKRMDRILKRLEKARRNAFGSE